MNATSDATPMSETVLRTRRCSSGRCFRHCTPHGFADGYWLMRQVPRFDLELQIQPSSAPQVRFYVR